MKCPNCGGISKEDRVCSECDMPMSDPSDSLDSLVEEASVPNLAALFKSAKDAGLIKAQQEYGHQVP